MMTVCGAVPAQNLAIYTLLYELEVAVRELIIRTLDERFGPRWWKARLPPDVLDAFRRARAYERDIKWWHLVPHHPLYYTEFPHLQKVLLRADNWKDAFQPIFGRQDILASTLSELEPIRNKIAHNRKATDADLRLVQAALEKIAAAIGEDRFQTLVSDCTLAADIPGHLLRLAEEAALGLDRCKTYTAIETLPRWEEVSASWWFDADYLGHDVAKTTRFFETLVAYRSLPRGRGSGHKIEAWVKQNDVAECYASAVQELAALLDHVEGR